MNSETRRGNPRGCPGSRVFQQPGDASGPRKGLSMKLSTPILIVDDNEALASTLQEIFEEEGIATETALDAEAALDLHRKHKFPLAVVDIKLPEIVGTELVSKLREINPCISCILMTGHATLESAVKAVGEDGVVSYELKPLNIDRLLYLVREVVARKKAEEGMQRKSEELRKVLAEKSEFLLMVSHELRTPLVPIVGYAEMLLDGSLGQIPETIKEPLSAICSGAESLKSLIEDLLLLSRMERGKLSMELRRISLGDFVGDFMKSYRDIDHGKPVEIEHEGEEFEVLADAVRLRQVLSNLIENAIKYSGESVEITIRTTVQGDRGLITIEDNGIGIKAEHLPRVFDWFYRMDPSETDADRGSGLGLAIVKELVHLMGGEVSAQSEWGEGSKFTASLPLAEGDDSSIEPEETKERVSSSLPKDGALKKAQDSDRLKILVVDDDRFTCELVCKMLQDRYELLVATSGSDGLSVIEKNHVDLVLLDWLMPGLDGLGVLTAIKAGKHTRGIPVLLLSGKAEPEVLEQGLEAGATGFITKPFRRTDLIERIERVLPT